MNNKKSFENYIVIRSEKGNPQKKKYSKGILSKLNAYWKAANYLSVGQLYLQDNPLLREPLKLTHVKALLQGHWGTTPGLNFIYVHLNRIIEKYDLNMICISGPGHGGTALIGNTYLEGTYTEFYPDITQDETGLKNLFTQFSFPGGISGYTSPGCPGSIQEGGELGYSLSHAFGAAFDNPELIVACIIGDGEAETGPLATSWHSNKYLNPITDGAVLPILHLNGYKTANPSLLARITRKELKQMLKGFGWKPYFVEGDKPKKMHQFMSSVMDKVVRKIRKIQNQAGYKDDTSRPRWPMIVLNSPKGWTGPKIVDNVQIEGTSRSHRIPLPVDPEHIGNLKLLEHWMKSYKPDELFDREGHLFPELAILAPLGIRRMGANPHANGGLLLQELNVPEFSHFAVDLLSRGSVQADDANNLGEFFRELIEINSEYRNFRIFTPDQTLSNQLNAVFEVTNKQWLGTREKNDEYLSPNGSIIEMLSEHQCEGWLEGYLLTGRHGVYICDEAFIHIISSMVIQHANWLKSSAEVPWRQKIASLNYLLTSNIWQVSHDGITHSEPGFIDQVVNKKASIARVYLPPDDNCQLSVWDCCLKSKNLINLVVSGKFEAPCWLTIEEAAIHCNQGIGIWNWASNDPGSEPDVVLACCGDVPTIEILASVTILRKHLPDLKLRVINVVDLMKLEDDPEHPYGLSDPDFDALFTKDKPVIFAFHGYPNLIHQLTYRRTNHENIHVCGYKEENTLTTNFNMTVLNGMDRFHLVLDVIRMLPHSGAEGAKLKRLMKNSLNKHKKYIDKKGQDLPEILDWKWNFNII